MAPTQTRSIKVFVSTDGGGDLRALSKNFAALNTSVRTAQKAIVGLRNSFATIAGFSFAGLGLSQIVSTIDGVENLNNRLRSTEGSAEAATRAFANLSLVASQNFTSIEDTGVVYNRLALSLKELGLSSDATLGLTDALQKSFRITGSTAAEATGAVIQLSQGLAAGQLRGQELRSVTEANSILAGALAKQFGIARGELLKFAEKRGGFTPAEVIQAIGNGLEDINTQASSLGATISGALTANFNKLKVSLAAANTELGITEKAVAAINFTFENLDTIAIGVGLVGAFKAYTLAVDVATKATFLFNAAVKTLVASDIVGKVVAFGLAVAALPVSLVVAGTALVGVTAASAAYSDELAVLNNRLVTVSESQTGTLDTSRGLEREYRVLGVNVATVTTRLQEFDLAQADATRGFSQTLDGFKEGKSAVLVYNEQVVGTKEAYSNLVQPLNQFQKALADSIPGLDGAGKKTFDFKAELIKLNEEFDRTGNLSKYNQALKQIQITQLNAQKTAGEIDINEFNRRLEEIQFGKAKRRIEEVRGELAELNKQFGRNGNVVQYSIALEQLRLDRAVKDFEEGRRSLVDLNKEFNEAQLARYNRELVNGSINLFEFNELVSQNKVAELEAQVRSGTIAWAEYSTKITEVSDKFLPGAALTTGINNYLQQSGTLSQNIANAVTNTFGTLETAFIDFTNTGKFAFKDFAKSVLDDLQRIIVRASIIQPLARGILGTIGSGFDSGTAGNVTAVNATGPSASASFAARGASFDGNRAEFFAKGGIVDQATAFSFNGGKMGVMGEAGPEAILPLQRNRNGDLGVAAAPANVTINVVNNANAQIEQRESTGPNGDRFIELVITSAVKQGLANGTFDRQFSDQYGLRRKGA